MSEGPPSGGEGIPYGLPARLIHDLRTPLHQILGYSEMLTEQAQEKGQKDFVADLQKIHVAGKRLLSVIEDNLQPAGSTDARSPMLPTGEQSATSPNDKTARAKAVLPPSEPRRASVLVADDVENNRDVLSRRLERQGYAVTMVENGREALAKLRAEPFDLVLLDIMMPEMDGYEVLERLKGDEELRNIPIIMISALTELDSVVRCIEMGAEDYLPKPFNPTLLKARISACLEKKRARDREQELTATLHGQNNEMATWRKAQEADLAVARSTQQAIVASAIPHLNGWDVETVYRPLIQVGGDVYGWQQLDAGAWLFWIADATGHGVAAALFTTFVALLFHHASAASTTASEILRRVNDEFYSVIRGGAFMTACCAVIDADGRLTFAGAGHPPLLIRRRDASVEALPSLNTMMGIDPAMKVAETVTNLASGEVALLYTDGIYSLKSEGDKRLTMKNLTAAFARHGASANLIPSLLAGLVQQSGTRAFDDDVAAIALRRS